jgi:hypothetical protein
MLVRPVLLITLHRHLPIKGFASRGAISIIGARYFVVELLSIAVSLSAVAMTRQKV